MSRRRNPDLSTHTRSEGRQMTSKETFKNRLRKRAAKAALALTTLGAIVGVSAPAASALAFDYVGAAYTDVNGAAARQAGSHPDVRVKFRVQTWNPSDTESHPVEQPHRFKIDLPVGLLANPQGIPTCPISGLKLASSGNGAICPTESQIGLAEISGFGNQPVFNVEVPRGMPGLFAFNLLGAVVRLSPTVRPGEYGITMDSGIISQGAVVKGSDITFGGFRLIRPTTPSATN